MAGNYTYGLTKIEYAEILEDGGPGTSFTQLGYTNPGTTKFTTDAGTANEKFCEELSSALVSIAGTETITLNTQLIVDDADTLELVLGGTVADGVWSKPDTKPTIEYTLKITPLAGMIIQINRASIVGSMNSTLAREGDLFYVDVVGTILQPTLEGAVALTISEPPA
jgi:hypothetical protein